jgi:predicted transcriptional regulator of viral defense system
VRDEIAPPDLAIVEIADRQHGIVTFAQLAAAGVGKNGIARRVAVGRLHRIHRGVYAVGFRAISQEARWMAAVLALGGSAVLSHRSAAELWRLLPARGDRADVSVPGRGGRASRPGIRIHRPRSLLGGEVTERLRIPVTTPARTVADMCATCPAWEVRKATRQAEFLRLPLGGIETDGSRSDLETDFLALCARHRIREPEVNVKEGQDRVPRRSVPRS